MIVVRENSILRTHVELIGFRRRTAPMRCAFITGTLLLVLTGCSRSADRASAPNQRSERQRDSVLGASRLPGAAGVRHALEASDSGAARRRREDSASSSP
jgi:hypothetical protein